MIHRSTSIRSLTMSEGNVVNEREVDLVSVDYFFSCLLPKMPKDKSFSVAVMADFEGKGFLVKENGKLTWTSSVGEVRGLGATQYANLGEDKHYKPFEDMFNEVVRSAQSISGHGNLEITHTYRMEPHSTSGSERNERMRPDACFVKGPVKEDPKERTSWSDIACIGEFKVAEKEKDKEDVS